jgi:hypothetical protein
MGGVKTLSFTSNALFAFAFALAFLSVIPSGNLLHPPPHTLSSRPQHHALVFVMRSGEIPAFALAFASALAFALALVFLAVIPQRSEGICFTRILIPCPLDRSITPLFL